MVFNLKTDGTVLHLPRLVLIGVNSAMKGVGDFQLKMYGRKRKGTERMTNLQFTSP